MPRLDRPGPYSLETLRALPVPDLFETDPAVLKATLTTWFEAETGRTLYPMQVEMLLIEMLAYLWSLLATEARLAHLQRYAALADPVWLEQLGAGVSTPRNPAAHAVTTLRFTLAAASLVAVVIPAGTRVGAGSDATIFATLSDLVIPAGTLFADTAARAEQSGAEANGLLAGAVSQILDPVSGVTTAVNIDLAEGGADAEDVEAYRLRVVNALDRVSVGGPRQGYAERVMAMSSALIDVAVVRPQPSYIDIYPLTEAGAAGSALRATIKAELNRRQDLEDVPMGDEIAVKAPIAVTYAVALDIRATRDLARVQSESLALVAALAATWRRRLGSRISPSAIEDVVRNVDAVVDVRATGLAYSELAEWEFPVPTTITANVIQAGGAW